MHHIYFYECLRIKRAEIHLALKLNMEKDSNSIFSFDHEGNDSMYQRLKNRWNNLFQSDSFCCLLCRLMHVHTHLLHAYLYIMNKFMVEVIKLKTAF